MSADERLALSYGSDKAAYIANAYAQLVELCGDEKQARILTFYAHQGIVAGLRTGLASEGTPLVLPDGTPGVLNPNSWSPSADQPVWDDGKRLTFSIGESGRPQMEVDYWIAGRAKFSHLDRPEVGPYLSPDSYLHTHFRTELNESGSLTLLEAPSYRFHLRPDDLFQKRYPQPTVAVLEAANQGNEMVRDALWYSQHIGMEQYLVALRAVAAFEREPTAAHVVSVVDACHGLPARDNDPVASAVLDLPPNPSDLEERRLSPELFAALHEALRNVIEEGVLPGMIEAIREGAL